MNFRILDSARKEFRKARVHYSNVRPELGGRFIAAVAAAFDRIHAKPLSYARISDDVRSCSVKRFPYAVIYVIRNDEIVIVAIMHGHRRPGYWKRRLKDLGY
jgi:plasmid stabilization system protein ParE